MSVCVCDECVCVFVMSVCFSDVCVCVFVMCVCVCVFVMSVCVVAGLQYFISLTEVCVCVTHSCLVRLSSWLANCSSLPDWLVRFERLAMNLSVFSLAMVS